MCSWQVPSHNGKTVEQTAGGQKTILATVYQGIIKVTPLSTVCMVQWPEDLFCRASLAQVEVRTRGKTHCDFGLRLWIPYYFVKSTALRNTGGFEFLVKVLTSMCCSGWCWFHDLWPSGSPAMKQIFLNYRSANCLTFPRQLTPLTCWVDWAQPERAWGRQLWRILEVSVEQRWEELKKSSLCTWGQHCSVEPLWQWNCPVSMPSSWVATSLKTWQVSRRNELSMLFNFNSLKIYIYIAAVPVAVSPDCTGLASDGCELWKERNWESRRRAALGYFPAFLCVLLCHLSFW